MQLQHKRFRSHQLQLTALVWKSYTPMSFMNPNDNANDRERPRCVR
jgi:hypothetical protein